MKRDPFWFYIVGLSLSWFAMGVIAGIVWGR
jgi:hypothetical protein